MTGRYEDRIVRVIDHILANPAGDLSLDALADVAAMSRFHWHRVFRAMTGETAAEAVRRIRMQRASFWIVRGDPVADVARRVGYRSVRSFARAFAEVQGMTPAAFRVRGETSRPSRLSGKDRQPCTTSRYATNPRAASSRWNIAGLTWRSAAASRS